MFSSRFPLNNGTLNYGQFGVSTQRVSSLWSSWQWGL